MSDENIKPVDQESTEFVDKGISSGASGDEWGEFLDGFIDDFADDTPAEIVDEVIEGLTDIPKSGEEDIPPVVETPTPGAEDNPPADKPEDGAQDDEVTLEIPPPATPEVTPPNGDTAQYREQYKQQLTQAYALSPEQAEEFEINPAEALPKFAAELHLKVLENVMATVQNTLPNTMQTLLTQTETARRNETDFFDKWPELQGHQTLIGQKAAEYRKANPQASKEDAIKMVGFNTLLALGVDPVQAAERLRKGFVQPVDAPNPGIGKPHIPAASVRQGSPGRSQPQPAETIWQEMLED